MSADPSDIEAAGVKDGAPLSQRLKFAAWIALATSGAAQCVIGCGSSSGGSNNQGVDAATPQDSGVVIVEGPDARADGEASPDTSVPDGGDAASSPDGGDAALQPDADASTLEAGDGALPLGAGSLLVAGGQLTPYVVTQDGYVAYANDGTGFAYAVAVAGGAPAQVASGTPGAVAMTGLFPNRLSYSGSPAGGVAVFTDTVVPDGGVPNLPLTTWTASGGAQSWWGPASLSSDIGGSADGSHVSWSSLDSTGRVSLYVSSSTPQQSYTVENGVAASSYPYTMFGGVGGTDLIVGLASGGLDAFDSTKGTSKTISSTAQGSVGTFMVDPTGVHVAFLDGSSAMWVATAPTYSAVEISSVATFQSFPVFSPDGSTLYFVDTNGVVYRSPVASPSVATIATGALYGFNAVSPDGKWLLVSKLYASNPFPEYDVQLVSAQATGATLTAVDTQARAFEQTFTTDSSHVLEAASPSTVTGESGGSPLVPQTTLLSYDITTKAVAPPISTTMLGVPNPATGTLVVFFDNPRVGSVAGRLLCDLRLVDVSGTSPVSSLVQPDVECGSRLGVGAVPSAPLLSADRTTVVYSYQGTAYRAGIYAYALP
jgi:hypothetical protein